MNISDLRKKLDSKEISAQEIFDEYFKKAEEENKKINCFININKEYSKKRLSKENNSILSNIPGVIKDNISIKDTITTAGSRMLEKYKSPYTASVVLNLKDFMLIGKGNMDSFALGIIQRNHFLYQMIFIRNQEISLKMKLKEE